MLLAFSSWTRFMGMSVLCKSSGPHLVGWAVLVTSPVVQLGTHASQLVISTIARYTERMIPKQQALKLSLPACGELIDSCESALLWPLIQ